MPKKETIERMRRDKRAGKSASTQAGEFVREEIEAIRKGEHGARSAKQAIAIGLSKARRAGVKLPVPKKGGVPEETRKKAKRELAKAEAAGDVESPQARGPHRGLERSAFKAIPPRSEKTHLYPEVRSGKKGRADQKRASGVNGTGAPAQAVTRAPT